MDVSWSLDVIIEIAVVLSGVFLVLFRQGVRFSRLEQQVDHIDKCLHRIESQNNQRIDNTKESLRREIDSVKDSK